MNKIEHLLCSIIMRGSRTKWDSITQMTDGYGLPKLYNT